MKTNKKKKRNAFGCVKPGPVTVTKNIARRRKGYQGNITVDFVIVPKLNRVATSLRRIINYFLS